MTAAARAWPSSFPRRAPPPSSLVRATVWRWGPLIYRGQTYWPGHVGDFPAHLLDDHPGVLIPVDPSETTT